jgi:urease gamma subunit
MTKPETNKLYVNLSASQARKRLKGRGFGVRKVEATGDHQSVIVHTATGGHLRDLESLFFDVMLPGAQEEFGAEPGSDGGRDDSEVAPDR